MSYMIYTIYMLGIAIWGIGMAKAVKSKFKDLNAPIFQYVGLGIMLGANFAMSMH